MDKRLRLDELRCIRAEAGTLFMRCMTNDGRCLAISFFGKSAEKRYDEIAKLVTHTLRLPSDHASSVMNAFLDEKSDWQTKRRPWAFLRQSSINREMKRRGLSIFRVSDVVPNGHEGTDADYIDHVQNQYWLKGGLYDDGSIDSWQDMVEVWARSGVNVIELVAERAGLHAEETTLLKYRLDGGTRATAVSALGWDQIRVERVWKALTRKMRALRFAMMEFLRECHDRPDEESEVSIQRFVTQTRTRKQRKTA